jgi:hypothetical protein
MSQIRLTSSASGIITVATPTTSANRTLTLPDNTGTVLSNGSTADYPAGSLVQFKHEAFTSGFSTSSSTYQDAYSFSFTPTKSTNKILLQFTARMHQNTASRENRIRFLRDSTEIYETRDCWNTGGGIAYKGIYEVVDIPGTTSAITYKLQCRNETNGSGTFYILYATDGTGYYNGPPMLRAWEIQV